MKNFRAIACLAPLLLLAPVAFAQGPQTMEAHAPTAEGAVHPPAAMPMDMDMNAEIQKHMQHMQANVLRMHDLMHKIQATKAPKERAKLTQEHLELMNENMDMMVPMMMHMMMSGDSEEGEEGEEEGEDAGDSAPMPNPAAP